MTKDFYLDERALAAYFEKDWYDRVLTTDPHQTKMTFAPFEALNLYCDYHEKLIGFLAGQLIRAGAQPKTVFEVGSSLGRTFFEICRKIKSVQQATLIEPSENLATTFTNIFQAKGPLRLRVLKGNVDLTEVTLDTQLIQSACAGVELTLIPSSFQSLTPPPGPFDLTVCSNVIDQCRDPEKLAELLKTATALNGVLVISCTYQWQTKYIGNATKQIQNIADLFGPAWHKLGETNIPFQLRGHERYWKRFLSHVLIMRRGRK